MKLNKLMGHVFVVSAVASLLSLAPQSKAESRKASRVTPSFTTHAVQSVTNGILTLEYDEGSGLFTINTGANHPSPNQTVFFPLGTSYITLRDATSKIMWVNIDDNVGLGPSTPGLSGYTLKSMLDEPVSTTGLSNGFRTVYSLPGFDVTEDVLINGTTLANTNILHQVRVRNSSTAARSFGLRYQWDWQIAGNDASLFRRRSPDGAFTSTFETFVNPGFRLYEEVDDATSPTFSIFGSVSNLGLTPAPTVPDQLRYASWSEADNSAWDFDNLGSDDDSSVVYYWGFGTPISLAAGATQTFAQYVTTQLGAIAQPTLRFSASTYGVNENGATANITIQRAGNTTTAVSAQFATSNGTATAPSDYTAVTQTVSFAPGETTKIVSVPIIDDNADEPNETVNLTLSAPVGATLGTPNTAVLNIIDNDDVALPTLSINDVSKVEGNTTTSNATFTVTLSAASAQAVTVHYATTNPAQGAPAATAGSDYTATSGTLNIPAGQTSATINVPVIGDTTFEANETFNVNLTNPTNATIADAQGVGTITNDDAAPPLNLRINDVNTIEGNPAQGAPGTKNLTFTVTLSATSAQPVTVQYATANGTGTAGLDYVATSGTLTIAAGQTSGTIDVPIVGDTVAESNDQFVVNLSNPTNATIADAQGVGTIINDDAGPGLSINDVTVTEGNSGTTNATFTITLAAASTQTVSVNVIPSNGTARSPGDYVAGGVHLIFAPGETTKTFSVPVKGDLVDEPDETFFVVLSSAINATVARGRAIGTVIDDDAVPTISIDDVRIGEGNSGQRVASFRLRLSAPSGQVVRVSYATASGTATPGNDYVQVAPTQIAFTTGNVFAYARVFINGDVLNEPDETFYVNLSAAQNATIARAQAIGTILNDDSAPALSISDASVSEGNSGTKLLNFTVTLSKASGQAVSVNYNTTNGTAISGSDYVAKTGTLTFAPGSALTQTISVTINGDTVVEGNETLFMFLSGATNASVGRARGVGTILNDDASG